MDNTRRSFDRSRLPAAKKPRLTGDPNGGSKFPHRQTGSSSAFNGRHPDGGGGGDDGEYHPQPLPHQELVAQYKTALGDLTSNHKLIITNLTIIAEENLPAAKSIAGTICDHILEVPIEQKLPSLYLLDSIVKNIGRDYKRYFTARLPEVFCKAYRQVDPSVQSNMRRLFRTWNEVFPLQTLLIIEKELGFTRSIHVNPEYFERQHLQQSSTTKGGVNDMAGALYSNEESERPDRALAARRPWRDPRVNMHNNQLVHRDAFNDSDPERSIGGPFGGNEYSSGISSKSGSGVGRNENRLIGGVAETLSSQRNGFSLKHSLSNHEAPKSMNKDAHHQSTQAITDLRSNVMSGNWKDSEEEEFMWDEMNSGLTDKGRNVSSNLRADPWMADDENLKGEDHLFTSKSHPFGEKVDREISTGKKQLPAFGGQSSLSWQLQKPYSRDKLNLKPGHSEGSVSTLGGLPGNINSSAVKMRNRSFMPNATTGVAKSMGHPQFDSGGAESPSGQSPLRTQSPSLSVSTHLPHSVRNLAEQDYPPIPKTSQFLGSQYNPSPALPHNVKVGNLRKSQDQDMHGPLSSVTPRTDVTLKTKKAPQSKVSLASETSAKSTTNSLSAASVKTGIIPNKSTASSLPATSCLDGRSLPSQSVVRPARSGGPSPTTSIPQRKAGQPQRGSTQPVSSNVNNASVLSSNTTNKNALNPIENLLNSLVAKGLISAKTKSATIVPSDLLVRSEDQTENIATSSSLLVPSVTSSAVVPELSSRDDVDDAAKASQSTSVEVKDLIGFDFKPDVIREMHPHVIRELLDDLPHHCRICGVRLKQQEQFNRHLEWHATREKEQNGLILASRRWYANSNDWIACKSEYQSENESTDSVDVHDKKTDGSQWDTMVLADENQCLCVFCGELFEDVYCQEKDQWMFKGGVYLNNSDSKLEMKSRNVGPIVHARCLSENPMSNITNTEHD
ncbi:polyadenylation and cleavage factor homolog 4-like isoform X2 [Lotus japonicus]|uniref:polyadenylation and cleavage factor homolog 4-like isoform X2 n=1 Tax=Lotus japonicus TaxID=34305 RepID=UPI0025877D36|nr:polyadenylation and cleavage factor homolog 4-like isoform X2 [Lotus japonicus]